MNRPLLVAGVATTTLLFAACGEEAQVSAQPGPCSCTPSVVARADSLAGLKAELRRLPLPVKTVRRVREGIDDDARVYVLEDDKHQLVKVRAWQRDNGTWVAREQAVACM